MQVANINLLDPNMNLNMFGMDNIDMLDMNMQNKDLAMGTPPGPPGAIQIVIPGLLGNVSEGEGRVRRVKLSWTLSHMYWILRG